MKIAPILIHGLDGRPVTPLLKADLEPAITQLTYHTETLDELRAGQPTRASEATLQALLAAFHQAPSGDDQSFRCLESFRRAPRHADPRSGRAGRRSRRRVVPTLTVNGVGEMAIPLAKVEVRDQLDATTLHLACASGGGSLVLELHGR